MKDILFTRILDDLDQINGRVSLASATFELVAAPNLDIHLTQQPT